MLIGDQSTFAIESHIFNAYPTLGLRGLGFFVLYLDGRRYGIREPDATMLACSYDSVKERIAAMGKHTAPFAEEPNGGDIAKAFRKAMYSLDETENSFFGLDKPAFSELWYGNQLVMAPDGDEAFDDSSYVLQFDIGDRVRLIGFTVPEGDFDYDPVTLKDLWLESAAFYGVLKSWLSAFESEWEHLIKAINR